MPFILADQTTPSQSSGGGGGSDNNSTPAIPVPTPILITLVSPDYSVYAKSWNISSEDFTFFYEAETEPYYCILGIDWQPASDIILVDSQTQATLHSNTTLSEGEHSWLVFCANSTTDLTFNGTSEERHISIDNSPPELVEIYPSDNGYIGGNVVFNIQVNGTGSPPGADVYLSDGTPLSANGGGGGGSELNDFYYDYNFSNVPSGTIVHMNLSLSDAAGNTAYRQFSFEVDNTPPEVTISSDKAVVNNAGNNPSMAAPPINFTASITDKHLASYTALVYDNSKNMTVFLTPYLKGKGPYWFLWDTKYYSLEGTEMTAVESGDGTFVFPGNFIQNTSDGYATFAFAYFNSSTGKFLKISTSLDTYSQEAALYENLSTFEPLLFKGAMPNWEWKASGTVLTASGSNSLYGPSGEAVLTGAYADTGSYTAYIHAADSAGMIAFKGFGFSIDNSPPYVAPPAPSGGGGGGGGAAPAVNNTIVKKAEPKPAPAQPPQSQPATQPEPKVEQPTTESPTGFFVADTGLMSAIGSLFSAIAGFFAHLFG